MRQKIEKICKQIKNTSNGNCGMFAYALAKVLGTEKCKFVFLWDNNFTYSGAHTIKGYENCFGLGHVLIKYGKHYYDGERSYKNLKEIEKEWAKYMSFKNGKPKISFEIKKITDKSFKLIKDLTWAQCDWKMFYNQIKQNLNIDKLS